VAHGSLIRKRVKVALAADPAQPGAGGFWTGLAGAQSAQGVAAAERFACEAHRDHPHLGHLFLEEGCWWVEVETCCEELMAHVEREVGGSPKDA
jgi:hypothetical protein